MATSKFKDIFYHQKGVLVLLVLLGFATFSSYYLLLYLLPAVSFSFSVFYFYLFIYFGCVGSLLLLMGFSLAEASGGYSSLRCTGFSLRLLLLLWSTGSRRMDFSSCGMWAQQLWLVGSRAQVQQLWYTGLVAPWHVGSSRTRARTRVPCIGRRILNHCATREAPVSVYFRFVPNGGIKERNVCIH